MEEKTRVSIAALTLSAVALVGLAEHESFSATPYYPTKWDKLTIGFGTTGGVKEGDRMTPSQGLRRMMKDVSEFEGSIKECIKVPLTQNEYDAFVDLAYNIGGKAFCYNKNNEASIIVSRVNKRDYVGGCEAILEYKYSGGKDCSVRENGCYGVWVRRMSERNKCLGG